jgi:hypothetical protein
MCFILYVKDIIVKCFIISQLSSTVLIVVYVFLFINVNCVFLLSVFSYVMPKVCLSSLARHFGPVIKSVLLRHSSSAAET